MQSLFAWRRCARPGRHLKINAPLQTLPLAMKIRFSGSSQLIKRVRMASVVYRTDLLCKCVLSIGYWMLFTAFSRPASALTKTPRQTCSKRDSCGYGRARAQPTVGQLGQGLALSRDLTSHHTPCMSYTKHDVSPQKSQRGHVNKRHVLLSKKNTRSTLGRRLKYQCNALDLTWSESTLLMRHHLNQMLMKFVKINVQNIRNRTANTGDKQLMRKQYPNHENPKS